MLPRESEAKLELSPGPPFSGTHLLTSEHMIKRFDQRKTDNHVITKQNWLEATTPKQSHGGCSLRVTAVGVKNALTVQIK